MTLKSYLLLSGGTLLATYLVTAQPGVTPEPASPAARVAPQRAPARVDIQEQAARLQTRERDDVAFSEPSRNPFRFGGRPSSRAQSPPREPVEQPSFITPDEPPPPPPIRLSGIATEVVDGARRRMAILVTVQGVLEVREGSTVPPDYRVARIEEDAIELVSSDGTSRRLKLRP